MQFLEKIFGDPSTSFAKKSQFVVGKIGAFEKDMEVLTADDFPKKTLEFKERLGKGESLDDILPEAFALVREVSKRTVGMRHFDVQLLGGMALHKGHIAEMRTGEGKTLVATLPVYLNALMGKGVHVITVNDYLARRDAVWMGQIYDALGMSVGCVAHDGAYRYNPHFKNAEEEDAVRDAVGSFKIIHEFLEPVSRKEAYGADITYGTNNEFGFDYLRDNMAYKPEQVAQENHYFAIIDEMDSILIDEARTPLIISAPDQDSGDLYQVFAEIVPKLKAGEDYNVDEKQKATTLTEEGIEKAESLLGIKDIYTEKGMRYVHHLEQALRAEALYKLDKDYVVKDGEIIIVDEFTGRLMPGRRWSEGLHQAIEAKEKVPIQKESRTLASITFQNYFRLYEKIAGMTGTAKTSTEEFHKVYGLNVATIPTNKPLVRDDKPDQVYQTYAGKMRAVIRTIKECHERRQPILVGTISIDKNEYLSALLKKEGVPHQVLNAKNHESEASIIAQAGRPGAVTIATNMAGRGVDIILGGNPPDEREAKEVRNAGGLFMLGTERHEARRIDNQLRGRAGRQGDPGVSQFYVSLEDDLMRIFGSDRIKNLMGTFGIPEDEPIENRMVSRSLESAQAKIEGFHFDARKHLLDYDDVMNRQREAVYRTRKELLKSTEEDLKDRISTMIEEDISHLVGMHTMHLAEDWNITEIIENIHAMNISTEGLEKELTDIKGMQESDTVRRGNMEEVLIARAHDAFAKKEKELKEGFLNVIRFFALQTIDSLWTDHLEAMDYTRSSVRLRAYGQRDPLVEYKNESVKLFRQFNMAVEHLIALNIFKFSVSPQAAHNHVHAPNEGQLTFSRPSLTGAPAAETSNASGTHTATAKQASVDPKYQNIGRNDPCPCGSGKKFKKCHGK
ncbi:MAG: preprotein translocase subunit SecA [Candidatus Ryanbacteria bacterium CG10_big_fil_rev_8_21_14_0_10_43_42]|uniref:Protein translocase subunit SecA n=1 Tax=Candidatus Ryanbacteria bacterium CG10_big_fil_rev_8_21_14_0_10_43_42 TaxID=1974864 RepID=A0A2M8KXH2_9BACT|nr:MAG: preprotein translocase subunit SecA [Candidatus Ryanbacteria bacterium CG10_big_fil_rev_8_21_14_0_10_43_42]